MKLYFAPGACSLSDHIALHEAGLAFEHEKVDLKTKRTASGVDYMEVNPKGYVPALTLDSGETLTENVALLDWIARQAPALMPAGELGETRLLEALGFLSAEVHKPFKPFHADGTDEEKAQAETVLARRFAYLADTMKGDFLFGEAMSTADAYLFVMLLWAERFGLEVPERLAALRERMKTRTSVRTAMTHEGLI